MMLAPKALHIDVMPFCELASRMLAPVCAAVIATV